MQLGRVVGAFSRLLGGRQCLARVRLQTGNHLVRRHDVAEGQIERSERCVVVLVRHRGIGIAHHDGPKIEHHGIARRRLAADIGYRTRDQDGIERARLEHCGKVGGSLNERAEAVLLDNDVALTSSALHSSCPLLSTVSAAMRFCACCGVTISK